MSAFNLKTVPGVFFLNGTPMIEPGKLLEIASYNVRDTFNPQEDDDDRSLVASMVANGFQTDKPVTVRFAGKGGNEVYIIAGHRRLAAVRAANSLGAKIRGLAILPEGKGETGEARSLPEMTLDLILSNSGKPLSPPERGAAFLRMKAYGWNDKQIAERSGVSDRWVRDLCKLARLDKGLRDLVKSGVVAPTLALETSINRTPAEAKAILEAAARIGRGKNAGKATGATVAAVTGKPAKNAKGATVPPVVGTSQTGKGKTVVPTSLLSGPFTLGTGEFAATLYDAKNSEMCDFPDDNTAKAMLILINQGWHVFAGKGALLTSEVVPTTPAKPKAGKNVNTPVVPNDPAVSHKGEKPVKETAPLAVVIAGATNGKAQGAMAQAMTKAARKKA